MVTFEGFDRREASLQQALAQYGFSSLEECQSICLDHGVDCAQLVRGVQPIAFDNAIWAYTLGCAIALKAGCKTAAQAAEKIGLGLQAFCIPGSVAYERKVGIGHGNLAAMLLRDETSCFCFLAGHESFAAAEGAIGIARTANRARSKPLRVILNGLGKDAAYIIARRRFRFGLKKPMTYWVLLVRVLPPVAFTIPLYTMFSKIGLLNTKIPVTLACVLINVPLIIWFLISFFQDLPEEVEESAKVDGATEWQLFRKIVLPLVAPGIAAVAMLSFMYAWNEYTYTVIFTRSPSNYTVPLALSVLNTEDNLTNFGLVAAGGVVSVIPITLFVIFAQNYLISGLSSGAVKE